MTATERRVALVTGPNGSGKSVYIKQVALIVVLAHVGSYVPAESATVGLVDRIFTRLDAPQSAACAVPQGSFARDTAALALALRHATPRSLLVVDEYGKGTRPADGAALLAASLRSLLARGNGGGGGAAAIPRCLFATHFSEVLKDGVLPRCPALSFETMTVVAEAPAAAAAAAAATAAAAPSAAAPPPPPTPDVAFVYRLVPGEAAASYGVACARLAGVPAEVVARAEAVARLLRANAPLGAADGGGGGNGAAAEAAAEALAERNAATVQALIDGWGAAGGGRRDDPVAFLDRLFGSAGGGGGGAAAAAAAGAGAAAPPPQDAMEVEGGGDGAAGAPEPAAGPAQPGEGRSAGAQPSH